MDGDGLTCANAAHLYTNAFGIVPCTPQGVIDLLKAYGIELAGKKATIIGRSMLVGKPLSLLMLNENATVTVCHSKTRNISEITKNSDIVVCALGKPKFLTADMVSDNCIVVDVGINRLETGLCGDADYEPIFIGKYNFNNDKSTEKVFGFTDIPGFDNSKMQCWEILNNGNPLALFQTIDGFDSGWKEAYESRYPDTKTPNTDDLKAFSHWMVECNYDKEILQENVNNGSVNISLARRIVKSHLGLSQLCKMIDVNDFSQTKMILLIHLSNNNSNRNKFVSEIARRTGKQVIAAKKGQKIELL